MKVPTEHELVTAIANATRATFGELEQEHPESFYYVSLITTGEAHSPSFVAWSEEALIEESKKDSDPQSAQFMLKWSYADSPYFLYNEENFEHVREMFAARPHRTDEDWGQEYELRLRAMESAMRQLDQEGVFGSGLERHKIVVAVEVMPPDMGNVTRVKRLNPPIALMEWMDEAAEI